MAASTQGGSSFWDRPATWKALLLVVVYLAFYLLVGRIVGWVFAGPIDEKNVLGSAASILLGVALPIAIGGAALLVVTIRLGWLADVFGQQPRVRHGWMWVGPVLVLSAIAAHVAGIDWHVWSGGQVVAMAVVGVCVGFTEELATRGLTVKILRDAGHGERYVAVVSSLVFALMHTVNLISGMSLKVVGATVVYTFAFGMCMYLALRLTGRLWVPMVLHGLTDPTTFLASGGLDRSVTSSAGGATILAVLATVLLILFSLVAVVLLRGRVEAQEARARPVELPG